MMYDKEQLSARIEAYMQALPFPQEPDTLYEPIVYSLERGGKRLRPLLAAMACNVFREEIDDVLPCAAAIEVFHNFTLLHDDIMDNAAMRRGKPSVQRKWGVNSAILSGDAMLIYAYRLLEQADTSLLPQILRIFNDTSLKVCEGQQYDMDFESLEHVPMTDYLHMIELKTAVLLAGATAIGAVIGGASEEDRGKLYTFAMQLGMAFQIRDDILDSYGTEATLGKKIGGDILEGKKTFLTTAAMETSDADMRLKLAGLLHNRELLDETKIARVLDIYDRLGIRERAEKAVADYTAAALEALAGVSAPEERKGRLRDLAAALNGRMH